MPLDPSSRRKRCAVRAAAPRSSATPIASTRCCGSCSPRWLRPDAQVAVLALGGYGRRHLCLHSDIDLLVLFGGRIGAAEERFLRALPASAVGSRRGRRPSGARARRLRPARDRQPRVPAGAARRAAGRRRRERSSIGSARCSTRAATHAYILKSLLELIEERHAALQRHAVSARARREGGAGRAARSVGDAHDRDADRSAAAAPGSGRSGARSTTPRTSCCACARSLHLEAGPQSQRPQPRAAGADRRAAWAIRAPSRGSGSSG